MKNILSLLFMLSFSIIYSQKYTVAQVENTEDPKIIAAFLKENPGHPKTGAFKVKLVQLITKDNDISAKPTVKPLSKEKLARDYKRDVRDGVNNKNKQTANVLTELFNNDPNKKEVVIQIKNKSDCNLIVKFSGKDFYNLNVPARNQNFVVVKKGNYILSTIICDAKYSSAKNLTKDLAISLDAR